MLVAGVSVAVSLVAVCLDIVNLDAVHTFAAVGDLIFPVVGLIIIRSHPRNTVAWAFMVSGLLNAINHLGQAVALIGASRDWPESVRGHAAWLTSWTWFPALAVLITIGLLHFPDGRPLSPRWRWLDALSIGVMAWVAVAFGVGSWGLSSSAMLSDAQPSPSGWRSVVFTIGVVGLITVVPCVVGAVVSLVIRWRRSSGVGRLQIRWVAAAGMVAVFVEILLGLLPSFGIPTGDEVQTLVETLSFGLIVVATGFAILRYRLYEIDRVVSRTVGYAVVTALLVSVYVGVAALASTFIPPRYGSVGVAAGTLAVAALFVPVRRRVQHLVDRRFDRARYDAALTVERFAVAIRHELSQSELSAELMRTVQHALSPASTSIWLVDRTSKVQP